MTSAKNRILVCLSGKSSSGKSMLINLLKQDGYYTINLDELIHQYYQKGQSGYDFVVDNFGLEYVDENQVNRKKLGQLVFANPDKLKLLSDFAGKIAKNHLKNLDYHGLVIVEGAAIYNNQERYQDIFDYFVLVERDEKLIQESIAQKFAYLKDFDFKKWNPIKENKEFEADFCIQNNGDIRIAYQELLKFLKKISGECEL
ncbi:dephospho-CoA kinase [Mycoplasma tullyi]|uniref:Dephospho-CoA kinase n=1 Tax=Mycoplasma tullyi TaxID=1612150 RepID=A0A7D7UBE2_9MOLU|nr:dephospho-CoA kinase [Mycoplasma tullyi]QMT98727.1 dephospho-CoA kinase [Mycoplasma tullyi]